MHPHYAVYYIIHRDSNAGNSFAGIFDIHVPVHRDKFLIIIPTTCINFSNLFLKWNSMCFGQFLCPSSGVFQCTHSNGMCHTGLLTAVNKPVWHIPLLCVQWKSLDDGQRNCLKRVEFHFKNKFEKSVHLVGINIRNCWHTHAAIELMWVAMPSLNSMMMATCHGDFITILGDYTQFMVSHIAPQEIFWFPLLLIIQV